MGKLIIFVGIVVATVIVLGIWWLFLDNRREKFSLGLKGSKRRIAELEATTAQQTDVLREIHEIADASAQTGDQDPVFDLIARKAAAVLPEGKKA